MKGHLLASFLVLCIVRNVCGSAIPIWEMLTYQEKMGRLMYTYVHLVERYCKISSAPDCRKVMTLHGISNLLNYDEHALDLLDPDQRNASKIVWQAATKSQYKYPPEKSQDHVKPININQNVNGGEYDMSDSNEEPQTVRVPAPKFLRWWYWHR